MDAGERVGHADDAAVRRRDERAELLRRLAQADARFRDIIERNADAIMVIDDAGVVRFVNAMAERLFGRPRSELVGSHFGFPLLAGETTELDLPRTDGARVVEMRVVESEWEGHPARLASLRDVTARKESERAARQLIREQSARAAAEDAARRFRFLADCSTALSSSLDYEATLASLPKLCVAGISDWAVLYVVREEGTVQRLEVAHRDVAKAELVRALRDLPWEPPPDHPVRQVVEHREPLLVQRVEREGLESFAVDEAHLQIMSALGAASYMIVPMIARDRAVGAIALVASDPGRVFGDDDLALARDLALRAALALDNARLYRAAQEANQAKTDFLAVISHDLRTPLASIMGYADLLEMGVPDALPESGVEKVERIRTAANHLLYLIDELLAYARLDAGRESLKLRDVDARDVVREVVSVLEPLATKRGLAVRVRIPDEPIPCTTDPDKLRQSLVNLAWNAVKFTPSGEVALELSAEGERIRVAVRDTGVGIPAEHLEHIFQPFWQVRSTRRGPEDGTGLGLSVVRRLVHMLGGDVGVDSEVGRGSTFTVMVPRTAPAEAEAHAANGNGQAATPADPAANGASARPAGAAAAPAGKPGDVAPATTRRTSASAERLEQVLERIIEQNVDGMLVVDAAGTVRFANPAASELFGRTREELVGRPFGFPLVPSGTTELDLVGKGEQRVAELRVVDFDWDGDAASLVSIRDITDRRRMELDQRRVAIEQARRIDAEERARRARFLSDVSASLDASLAEGISLGPLVSVCCAAGFIDWCGIDLVERGVVVRRAASADDEEVLLSTSTDVHATTARPRRIDPDTAARLRQRTGENWSSGWVLYAPLRVRQEGVGAVVFARRSAAFGPADVEVAAEVAKRTSAAIEHAYLLEKAQRAAEAKSDFLAIVSHELRTPLNAVIGYSDLLLHGVAEPLGPRQTEYISKVMSSSKHLLGLVEEILTYTRMEHGEEAVVAEPVTVGAIVRETADMIAPVALEHGLEFRLSLSDEEHVLVTDAGKARQILTNLLSNAVKYTEEGWISLEVEADAAGVAFRISDSGIGITPDQMGHIFEPFWQAEPSHTRRRGGTGLGLTVAHELTRLLGGRVTAESEPGRGSVFTIWLPDVAPGVSGQPSA